MIAPWKLMKIFPTLDSTTSSWFFESLFQTLNASKPPFEVELSMTPAECQAPANFDCMVLLITISHIPTRDAYKPSLKPIAFEAFFPHSSFPILAGMRPAPRRSSGAWRPWPTKRGRAPLAARAQQSWRGPWRRKLCDGGFHSHLGISLGKLWTWVSLPKSKT